VELLEAGEPDQVPAVPTDTEAAAALTLRQAAGFAWSTVCCCSTIGTCVVEHSMFCAPPTKEPTARMVL
jgi:hypothetical protein